ncbi:MAG: hypothetical protein K9K88_11915, partial [Desulfobacterales bacterium]|nr:hypothetical protein [Desulfobacterales bacterium]
IPKTAILPLIGISDQSFSHRIGQNVFTYRYQVFVLPSDMIVEALLPELASDSEIPGKAGRIAF